MEYSALVQNAGNRSVCFGGIQCLSPECWQQVCVFWWNSVLVQNAGNRCFCSGKIQGFRVQNTDNGRSVLGEYSALVQKCSQQVSVFWWNTVLSSRNSSKRSVCSCGIQRFSPEMLPTGLSVLMEYSALVQKCCQQVCLFCLLQ